MADPLSIITASFQLGGVCAKLAKFLYEAANGIQSVDDDLKSLAKEILSLQTSNEAIRKHFDADINGRADKAAEAGFGRKGAGRCDGDLWEVFGESLADCRATLDELGALCSNIEGGSSCSRSKTSTSEFIQRSKRWIRKYLKDGELAKFRQRIESHQRELQVLLTAVNIIDTRRAQSNSVEAIAEIRSLRSELRKRMTLLEEAIGPGPRNEKTSLVLLSARAVMPLAYVNEHFSLPQAVSSVFMGRDAELDALTRAVFREDAARPTQQKRFVVYGLGGAGKSQFCCKWAQDNRSRFWGVFWVDLTSVQSAKKSFAEIAKLGKVDANERAAKAWLSSKDRPWLLIIDNADDPAIPVEQYFPEGERGVILVTTRNYQLKIHGTVGPGFFHFKELDSKASADLLLRTAGEKAPWSTTSLDFAAKICQKLGFLPLAIIHAGKAILSHVCSLTTYLDYFEQSLARVRQDRQKRRLSQTNITVFSSYELAFEGLLKKGSQTCEDAVELLKTFSFLHCRGIRVDTLIQAATNPVLEGNEAKKQQALAAQRKVATARKPLSKAAKDLAVSFVMATTRLGEVPVLPKVLRDVDHHCDFNEIRLREALKELHQMSLLEYDASDDSYSMHSLIHLWVRERPQMSLAEQAVWCQAAGTVLSQAVLLPPLGSRESDEDLRRDILPHVYHVQEQETRIREQTERNIQRSERWWRFWPVISGGMSRSQIAQRAKFSLVYAQNGLYREALKQQQIVADFLCRRLGKDNPITIRLLLFMSDIYWALTEGDKASDLLEDLLGHCVASPSLGADHEDTIRVLEKLGNTRWQQSRFVEARDLLEDVVRRLTRLHGPDHPDTLRSKSSFGRALGKFFEFDRAVQLHREALAGLQKDAAFQRSHTEMVLDNLAMAYFDRYYYNLDNTSSTAENDDETEEEEEEGEKGRRRTTTRSCRADIDKAHELLLKLVEGRRAKLGKEHPITLFSTLNLARVKGVRGEGDDLAVAEKMIRDGMKIAIRNIGERHLGILYCKAQLARLLMTMPDTEVGTGTAAPSSSTTNTTTTTPLPPPPPAGRIAEAEAILLEVNATFEESWPGHGDQMVSMAYLIGCYQSQGRMQEAAVLTERLLEGTRRMFGEGSCWEEHFRRKYQR